METLQLFQTCTTFSSEFQFEIHKIFILNDNFNLFHGTLLKSQRDLPLSGPKSLKREWDSHFHETLLESLPDLPRRCPMIPFWAPKWSQTSLAGPPGWPGFPARPAGRARPGSTWSAPDPKSGPKLLFVESGVPFWTKFLVHV